MLRRQKVHSWRTSENGEDNMKESISRGTFVLAVLLLTGLATAQQPKIDGLGMLSGDQRDEAITSSDLPLLRPPIRYSSEPGGGGTGARPRSIGLNHACTRHSNRPAATVCWRPARCVLASVVE